MRQLILIILLPVLLFFMWGLGYPYPFYLNNYRLAKFAQKFEAVSLPPATVKVGKLYKEYGNVAGNSNHGDYFVARLIRTSLSEKEIMSFYKNITIPHARYYQYQLIYMQLAKIKFNNPDSLKTNEAGVFMWREVEPHKWFKISAKDIKEGNHYVLYVFDPMYPPDDIRCR